MHVSHKVKRHHPWISNNYGYISHILVKSLPSSFLPQFPHSQWCHSGNSPKHCCFLYLPGCREAPPQAAPINEDQLQQIQCCAMQWASTDLTFDLRRLMTSQRYSLTPEDYIISCRPRGLPFPFGRGCVLCIQLQSEWETLCRAATLLGSTLLLLSPSSLSINMLILSAAPFRTPSHLAARQCFCLCDSSKIGNWQSMLHSVTV